LATIKTEAVKNDPVSLKRRIAELEKQVREKPVAAIDPNVLQKAKTEGFKEGVKAVNDDLRGRVKIAKQALDGILDVEVKVPKSEAAKVITQAKFSPTPKQVLHSEYAGDLTGPERRILTSLSFWKSIGHETPTKDQVAAVAGYSPIGGAFGNPMGKLRSNGIIGYPSAGIVRLSNGHDGDAMTNDEAKAMMLSILGGPEKRIIAAFDGSEESMSRGDVAAKVNYKPVGGAFGNPVGRLCTLGILEKPTAGMLKLSGWAAELLS
jgi:hypothetical protein